ncbi:MAG: hypothetical protein B7Y39_11605 [Bdellovibrio sp. 28-41-41]|nr:MAG: hypothetical protein B7Y39_11605 [Bdellovibrio sp. 28-41-41]
MYSSPQKTDSKIQQDVINEIKWDYQRNAAKDKVSQLMGVCCVTNSITIKSKVQPPDIKVRIEAAFKRSTETESQRIEVSVKCDKVILTGNVNSLAESDDARQAAWMAPGILLVENNLTISQ